MRKFSLILLILAVLLISAPAPAQVTRKAAVRPQQTAGKITTQAERPHDRKGILSMIPIVITTETKLKDRKNNLTIIISPTRINFGITF